MTKFPDISCHHRRGSRTFEETSCPLPCRKISNNEDENAQLKPPLRSALSLSSSPLRLRTHGSENKVCSRAASGGDQGNNP